MLFHTMVGSNDIERSKRFYDKVLSVLGVSEATLNIAGSGHTRLFYRNENGTNFIVTEPINDEPASVANGSTVAFSCNSPEQVKGRCQSYANRSPHDAVRPLSAAA